MKQALSAVNRQYPLFVQPKGEVTMRKIALIALTVLSTAAFAQQGGQMSQKGAQGTSGGVNIQGNTEIKADQKNVTAVAVGQGNTAKNTAGAIKGGTNIQGNTKIKASQKNATAVAVGKGNTAANEAGVIGGK
jgi:hypothetical protein